MPAYQYKCEKCGEEYIRIFSIAELKKNLKCEKQTDDGICNGVAERDYVGEHNGFAHRPGNWPMRSDAMGVHPDDAKAAYEASVKAGVPTQFDGKTGEAIFESPGHRKKYCETFGAFDRNGGYGDPQKGKRKTG